MENVELYIFLYYLIINIILLITMFVDKYRAINNKWRIREKYLFKLAIFGGGLGGLLGMYLFHHKTKKIKFKFIFNLSILLHIIIIYIILF